MIGVGPAGLAAAIAAAGQGLSIVLVDENPVSFRTMGDEVPLHGAMPELRSPRLSSRRPPRSDRPI